MGGGRKSRHGVYVGNFFVTGEKGGGGKKSRHKVYIGSVFVTGENGVVGRNPDTGSTLEVSL